MKDEHMTVTLLNIRSGNQIDEAYTESDKRQDELITKLMLLPQNERQVIVNMAMVIDSLDDKDIIKYSNRQSIDTPTERIKRVDEYITKLMALPRDERDEVVEMVLIFDEEGTNPILDS